MQPSKLLLPSLDKGIYGLWRPSLPYLALIGWTGLLLVASNGQQSLMAHDEGWYATQARWIVATGDWITPQWWGEPVYDRTIGIQWAIALCYKLFGISDGVARLPSLLACLAATLLTYDIGKRLLTNQVAWMGAAILPLCSLWLQYGRMAVQDIVLTCLELLGIWALLQADSPDRRRILWGLLAGMMVGLGFLIKSIMILLPIVALTPYLLTHRRHFTNPGIYLGLLIGAIPVSLWLWFSYQRYGLLPFQQLFGHLFRLGSKQFHADAGFFYYFWNIPINAFPWALLAIAGLWVIRGAEFRVRSAEWRGRSSGFEVRSVEFGVRISGIEVQQDASHSAPHTPHSALYLYPLLFFAELTVFSTRTPYYALQLYPFIGLLAAAALDWLAHRANPRVTTIVSYSVGGLAIVLTTGGLILATGIIPIPAEVRSYAPLLGLLGLGWLTLPWLWQRRHVRQWLAAWLLAPWLALASAGVVGLWGNYNADLKALVTNSQVTPIVQKHPVSVVVDNIQPEEHKTWVLLSFYTPRLGERLRSLADLSAGDHAWVSPGVVIESPSRYTIVTSIRDWKLLTPRTTPLTLGEGELHHHLRRQQPLIVHYW